MTNRNKSFISAAVAWGVAAWVFIFTAGLQTGAAGLIRPEFIPRVVALLLIILGIGMFIQGLRTPVTDEEKKMLAEKKTVAANTPLIVRLTPTLTLVFIFLFLLGLKTLGITVCTTLYLTAQMALLSGDFHWKSWLKYFIIGLITAVTVLLIFRYGFQLKLPVNNLGF